jgi:hypothetical protein
MKKRMSIERRIRRMTSVKRNMRVEMRMRVKKGGQ